MKKSLSILLAFALVFSAFASIVGAQEEPVDIGEKLRSYNILKGNTTDGGLDADKEWKRQDVTVIISRLLGAEEEAKSTEKGHRFSDVTDPHYDGYITWAKDNGYFNGHYEWQFGYGETITNQQFATVMLRVLGYEVAYEDAMQVAIDEGLFPEGTDPAGLSIRGDLFAVIDNTLKAENAEGEVLWEAIGLEEYEVVEDEEPEVPAFEVASLAPTGAKKLTVTFTQPVEGNAAFDVKRGSVTISTEKVEWNEAKTEATITTVSKFIAGTYTVTVSGIELDEGKNVASAEVAVETIAEINIKSDIAPLRDATATHVVFGYEVLNQYGEDMTSSAQLTWTASQGNPVATPNTGTVEIENLPAPSTFAVGQTILVTALHGPSQVYTTKTLKVGEVSRIAAINNVTLHHPAGAELNTNSNYAEYSLVVDAIDQYGNAVVNPVRLLAETSIVNTNPALFTLAGAFTENRLALVNPVPPATKIAGTSTVTVIANYTAQSKSIPVTVTAASSLDELILHAPADLVVQGETTIIPFTALDQHGNELSELAKKDIPSSVINGQVPGQLEANFVYNYATNVTELHLTANLALPAGQRVLIAVSPTGKTSQLFVDVKPAAQAVAVTSTKGLIKNFTTDGNGTLTPANLVVTDQYGREMAADGANGYITNRSYKVRVTSSVDDNVQVNGADTADITTHNGSVTLTGKTNGNSVLTVQLVDNANVPVPNSALDFTVSSVAKSAIVDYVVEAPEVLYAEPGGETDYEKPFNVYGTLASGERVALNIGDVEVVAAQDEPGFTFGTFTLHASNAVTGFNPDTGLVTKSLIITIDAHGGPVFKTAAVTVSNNPPTLTTINNADTLYMTRAEVETAGIPNVLAKFEGFDQYGLARALGVTNIIISHVVSNTIVVDNNTTGTAQVRATTATAGDTFKVTIYAANGIIKEANVVVIP